MRRLATAIVSIAAIIAMARPAQACSTAVQTELADVRFADVVVVGRIANYRIVLDQEVRRQRRQALAKPDLSPYLRDLYESQTSFLSDYARSDILVDEVLVGRAGRRLTVTWDNSTFSEPASMPPGPFLIALRSPRSNMPPLRGPSAYIAPNPEPNTLTILQAHCAGPFLFERTSEQARTVRRIIARK